MNKQKNLPGNYNPQKLTPMKLNDFTVSNYFQFCEALN